MIVSIFITVIFFMVNGLVSQFPTIDTNNGFANSLTIASDYLSALYGFIPYIISGILLIIAFDLIFEGAYLTYKVIYWVIRRFPTQS